MASLKAVMALMTGGYSSGINKVIRDTDRATNKILNASRAADKFNEKLESTGACVGKASDKISKASGVTDVFNNKLEATGTSSNIANTNLARMVRTLISLVALKKGMDISDEYMNTAARLNLINDGLQTQAELQDKIMAAANRSRGAYSDMANAVAKMGLLAKDAFNSNDELIAFTELVQKSFKIAGADPSEQAGAMRQLSQAMASGRLQGDEFVSITENAPLIKKALETYMHEVMGMKKPLKELATQGLITADVIKNAVFMAGRNINSMFEEMPITFGDIWNKIKNGGIKAFDYVIKKVNALINTKKFQQFIDKLISGFNLAAEAISWLIDTFVNGWNEIGPILSVVGTVYLAVILSKIIATTAALYAQATAWLAAYWPILLIVGVIGLAIAAARQLGATWDEIIGFIGGVIGSFVTFFYNKFVQIWNTVAAFINFFGNVFNNPIASIKVLFLDLTTTVLGYIEKLAKGIEDLLNKIGINVNITGGITKLKDSLAAKAAEIRTEADLKTFVQTKEYMDFSEGFEKGSQIGKKLVDKVQSIFDLSSLNTLGSETDLSQFGTSQNPLNVTGKVDVKMSDEDLKYLRDIAERDYINKFSTATLAPNIQITFGDVHEEADADKVAGRIRKILQEEIAMAAEGVYST